jgi:hypothetical protein
MVPGAAPSSRGDGGADDAARASVTSTPRELDLLALLFTCKSSAVRVHVTPFVLLLLHFFSPVSGVVQMRYVSM